MMNPEMIHTIENLLQGYSFSLAAKEKSEKIRLLLEELTLHHYHNCQPYRNILISIGFGLENINLRRISDFPFIPVSLFKTLELLSTDKGDIYKTIYSSGTSGSRSEIQLDRTTAAYQQKAMVKIVADFTGLKRSPMLIIDKKESPANTQFHSAGKTAILGFSMFASESCYALDEEMKIQTETICAFLDRNKNRQIFLFGFTYQVWLSLVEEFNKLNFHPDLSNAILIHGGGWKKTIEKSVSNIIFKNELRKSCNLSAIYNYYGMIEQTGNLFMECECGYQHCSDFGDVFIRNMKDFSVCEKNEPGIIQLISVLPLSYCGHNLLTGDEGILRGEDDCLCGRKGKYIEVTGRLQQLEPKGCSDV